MYSLGSRLGLLPNAKESSNPMFKAESSGRDDLSARATFPKRSTQHKVPYLPDYRT